MTIFYIAVAVAGVSVPVVLWLADDGIDQLRAAAAFLKRIFFSYTTRHVGAHRAKTS